MPDTFLGALIRPTDPREQQYALTRTLPPRAVDLSPDTLPMFTFGNQVNSVLRDAELIRQSNLALPLLQGDFDESYLIGRQSSAAMPFTSRITPLGVAIV